MKLRVVVPAKGFARGKSRLAPALDRAARRALNRRLLAGVLAAAALRVRRRDVLVVSNGADALAYARAFGAAALAQRGRGLDAALAQARRAARRGGADVIAIVASDLPFLGAADVAALAAAGARRGAVVIARDRAGRGTNALAAPAAVNFRFRFGPGSAAAHARAARRAGLRPAFVDRPGLAFDVDTPADHAAYAAWDAPGARRRRGLDLARRSGER